MYTYQSVLRLSVRKYPVAQARPPSDIRHVVACAGVEHAGLGVALVAGEVLLRLRAGEVAAAGHLLAERIVVPRLQDRAAAVDHHAYAAQMVLDVVTR